MTFVLDLATFNTPLALNCDKSSNVLGRPQLISHVMAGLTVFSEWVRAAALYLKAHCIFTLCYWYFYCNVKFPPLLLPHCLSEELLPPLFLF